MADIFNNPPPLTVITVIVLSTASILNLAQVATTYATAYLAAPKEISTFIEVVDFSIQENESYDRDVSKVPRLEDKLRLSRLLREIQKGGDDLREDLSGLLVDERSATLRSTTRLFWGTTRIRLEERVRRLDLLRMRFLVVYMGLVATKCDAPELARKDPEKHEARPALSHALTDMVKKPPPMRRLTTSAMGHSEVQVTEPQRFGWAGVVAELQSSPLMHKRRLSVERRVASP